MSDTPTRRSAGSTRVSRPDTGCTDRDAEPLGGDPPCWAHLFEDEDEQPPASEQAADR